MSHHGPRIEDSLADPPPGPPPGRDGLRLAGPGHPDGRVGPDRLGPGRRGGRRRRGSPRRSPPRPRSSPRKAKRVIHLFMNGGPSQVNTFDPKPSLDKYNGKPIPLQLPTERKTGAAMASPFKFKKYGQSGIEVSDLFAHVGECIDDICVIRSMHADVPNHEPSLMLMNCGEARQARPSVGSWLLYGLGSREPEPPRLRRPLPRRDADRRGPELAVGLPARDLPGDLRQQPAHRDREADRAHQEPPDQARRPAGPARPPDAAQPRAHGAPPGRGPARGPDPVVRAGLPDAVRGRRRLRRLEGAPGGQGPLRPRRPGPATPGRPPAPGAGRPLRPGLPRRRPALGQPRRHRVEPTRSSPTSATGRSPPC